MIAGTVAMFHMKSTKKLGELSLVGRPGIALDAMGDSKQHHILVEDPDGLCLGLVLRLTAEQET